MKKIILIAAPVLITATLNAQTKKPATPAKKPAPSVKPVVVAQPLKSLNDSASYAIGVSVANFYRSQGVSNINTALVSRGISDVLGNKATLLTDEMCNGVMNTLLNRVQEDQAKPNIEKGLAFLAKNKQRPEVKTTASGLQYEVVKEGTGNKPGATDSVTCHYAGTLIDGTEFDNSFKRGEPITFALNRVIPGWTEGLQLMPVGSKYKLYIPYQLGYGLHGTGPIPGGAVLIFDVELIDVKPRL